MAHVQFPDLPASHVGRVCWFSTLLREVSPPGTAVFPPGTPVFPCLQKPTYDLIRVNLI